MCEKQDGFRIMSCYYFFSMAQLSFIVLLFCINYLWGFFSIYFASVIQVFYEKMNSHYVRSACYLLKRIEKIFPIRSIQVISVCMYIYNLIRLYASEKFVNSNPVETHIKYFAAFAARSLTCDHVVNTRHYRFKKPWVVVIITWRRLQFLRNWTGDY